MPDFFSYPKSDFRWRKHHFSVADLPTNCDLYVLRRRRSILFSLNPKYHHRFGTKVAARTPTDRRRGRWTSYVYSVNFEQGSAGSFLRRKNLIGNWTDQELDSSKRLTQQEIKSLTANLVNFSAL
uniref:Uncharacterized protein n=1 Tax=Romanomermis culicivorax TaxID=13658 RepID=A0A915KK73_ROMCU